MPVAKIHVHEGAFSEERLQRIGDAIQAALEEVLGVPPDDYFRIFHVLPDGHFIHSPGFARCTYSYEFILLELTFIVSRPKQVRLELLKTLNGKIAEIGVRPDDLVVLMYELPGENISFGQGLAQRASVSAS